MSYDRFRATATAARKERTVSAVLALLIEYANGGWAIYPADANLFAEFDCQALGFDLRPYVAGNGGYTVHRIDR